jgi:hypothetical protein
MHRHADFLKKGTCRNSLRERVHCTLIKKKGLSGLTIHEDSTMRAIKEMTFHVYSDFYIAKIRLSAANPRGTGTCSPQGLQDVFTGSYGADTEVGTQHDLVPRLSGGT